MKQVKKTFSRWYIGFEGNGGVERNNVIVLYLAHFYMHVICVLNKYRTITFSLIIRPLFPSFLHHHCLQILYATNFLIENVFIYLSIQSLLILGYCYGGHMTLYHYMVIKNKMKRT